MDNKSGLTAKGQLDAIYPVMWLDAIHYKIKENGRYIAEKDTHLKPARQVETLPALPGLSGNKDVQ